MVSEIPEEVAESSFHCSLCDKICISQRGLTRHVNVKYKSSLSSSFGIAATKKDATEILHPLYFKKYLEECAIKLADDECYPEEVMEEFQKI